MWGSVLGPHTLIHFPTPLPFLSPHANTLPYSPHTLFYTPPLTSPLPTHLSFPFPHPNTLPYTSPHTPLTSSHSSPHLPLHPNTLPTHIMHSPTLLPLCGEVTTWRCYLHKFNWQSPINFFTTTGNLKSFLGAGNVNFRWFKVWRSYHVAKLLWRSYHVAKLLATIWSLL